jgi:hypothetical protein
MLWCYTQIISTFSAGSLQLHSSEFTMTPC